MRIVFAGTPEFALQALAALHAAGLELPLVLTQPDRPAGRGLKLQASPVKQFALEHGIEVAQPRSLRLDGKYPDDAAAAQQALLRARPDAMVVAAYGLILPQWVLDLPRLGCLNIHASLLPRWRGAAPIHRAIEAGDPQTGVTIMQMDAGLDTGAMLLTQIVPIAADDTTAGLHDKLAALGAQLIVQALAQAIKIGQIGPFIAPQQGGNPQRLVETRPTRGPRIQAIALHLRAPVQEPKGEPAALEARMATQPNAASPPELRRGGGEARCA
jgi:methionyl-tRNA formyltransferase